MCARHRTGLGSARRISAVLPWEITFEQHLGLLEGPADCEVSEYLVGHRGVDKVSFTGSVAAGRRVMEVASRNLTRVTLELGGKSAAVILPDADLEAAVAGIVPFAWMINGQACVAQTRILAPNSRYDEMAEAFAAAAGALRVGDPLDPTTELGPLVARRQQQRSLDYIRLGQEEGAKILTGGNRRPSAAARSCSPASRSSSVGWDRRDESRWKPSGESSAIRTASASVRDQADRRAEDPAEVVGPARATMLLGP